MAIQDDILINLRGLAEARKARGDTRLTLQPVADAQELDTPPNGLSNNGPQGLVLEPDLGSPFETRPLARRDGRASVDAFCDGIRSTYFVAFEEVYPILYTRNAAAVRTRLSPSGYHVAMCPIQRGEATLLAPFGMFEPRIRGAYDGLGLCPTRYGNLCWTPADDDNYGATPQEMRTFGSLVWQERGRRRARRLMERSEQIVAIAGARMLQERDPDGGAWLLKDGSLFQLDKHFLKVRPDLIQNLVSCVKTHPVAFFGADGERAIARLAVGERSVAFLPRPRETDDRQAPDRPSAADRPVVAWYLRVHPPNPLSPSALSGVVRLDIAVTDDWNKWVDEVSWAVLDEFYGLSARPDPRYDVMPYGIYDCEQFLKSQQIPGELLLAQLGCV